MGLEPVAHRGIRLRPDVDYQDHAYVWERSDRLFAPYVHPTFPGVECGIIPNSVYEDEERYRFAAGSYSGYNEFRRELARMAGYSENVLSLLYGTKERDFVEMIAFSDCEGVIGTDACARLSSAFDRWRNVAESSHGDQSRFVNVYDRFQRGFAMAADRGCMEFR